MPSPSLIETLKHAAHAAGTLLREGFHDETPIDFKAKGASDFVTHYDKAAENAIIDVIKQSHPHANFLGEETGITTANENSDLTVIIDPLDGTQNFLHRLPHFSVSIAVREGAALTHGVVYHPLLDEMLWAVQHQGAFLDGRRITTPAPRPPHAMLIATCLPYHGKGDCHTSLAQLTTLMPQMAGIRAPGSAALEVAYSSFGRFDAFWSQGATLEIWDIAAGIVIAREAGCQVTDLTGNTDPPEWNSLLVAHPERHERLLHALEQHPLSLSS